MNKELPSLRGKVQGTWKRMRVTTQLRWEWRDGLQGAPPQASPSLALRPINSFALPFLLLKSLSHSYTVSTSSRCLGYCTSLLTALSALDFILPAQTPCRSQREFPVRKIWSCHQLLCKLAAVPHWALLTFKRFYRKLSQSPACWFLSLSLPLPPVLTLLHIPCTHALRYINFIFLSWI